MSSLENCRLLFVDAEEQFLAAIAKFLRRRKLDVVTANSGQAGLEWFAANPVDIVILDIRMPDLNGVEVLKEMRRLKGDDFGVIILSGHAHTDIALDAMRAGANDFLLKPCSVDELLERIDMLNDRLAERRRA
jgi:DNA-binding response OmpR family regulator